MITKRFGCRFLSSFLAIIRINSTTGLKRMELNVLNYNDIFLDVNPRCLPPLQYYSRINQPQKTQKPRKFQQLLQTAKSPPMGKRTQKTCKKAESEQIPHQEHKPTLEIDYEGIYAHQKKLEVLCENAEHTKEIECFNKIKYKQNIYQVGEYVHLFDPTETTPYVVKIHAIIRVPGQQVASILKVQWLLRKNDLPAHYQRFLMHFSAAEVFPSGQFDYVLIQSVMRKCYVIQNSQYEYLQNAGDNIHFSRAVFDRKKGELDPHPSEWEKQCYCLTPVNPDLAYVQCEKCHHWFHNQCVGDVKLTEAEIFYCRDCGGVGKKGR